MKKLNDLSSQKNMMESEGDVDKERSTAGRKARDLWGNWSKNKIIPLKVTIVEYAEMTQILLQWTEALMRKLNDLSIQYHMMESEDDIDEKRSTIGDFLAAVAGQNPANIFADIFILMMLTAAKI